MEDGRTGPVLRPGGVDEADLGWLGYPVPPRWRRGGTIDGLPGSD